MFYFVFESLRLSNTIRGYSKAAASVTSISQKANSSKWLWWSSFLEGVGCVAILPLRNVFFVKNIHLQSHFILRFCLDFGNKNTEILLQLFGKCLTLASISLHIIIDWVLYKYTADILFLGCSWQFCIKIQNFVDGNNQFEKRFRQKLEKCFINIKVLPKLSVAMTLYQKSTKLYLIC